MSKASIEVPRRDPRPRSVDGAVVNRVLNAQPDRHYVLANPNSPETGVPYMESLGYKPVRVSLDKERMTGGLGAGESSDLISWRGQILMWCPMELHQQRRNDGKAFTDVWDERINQPGGIDGVRGANGKLAERE